jgi:tRNA pseudouridine55 synthase
MPNGILIVDKPLGPTSHAVVASIRKKLGTRAIGHAGTLDPAASGVLVVAVGEATKLTAYFTAHPKRYLATVSLGTSTDTCDAEGEIVARAPIDGDLLTELRAQARGEPASGAVAAAIDAERGRTAQVPPSFSAIKTAGVRSYARARKGEDFELPPRNVSVIEIDVVGATEESIDLSLFVSKGYYVRSLARDLGRALGVPAHLSSLRRTASGPFTIEDAIDISETAERIASAMIAVSAAAERVMPTVRLTDEGALFASQGKKLTRSHFAAAPPDGVSAWLDAHGDLVAIGKAIDADRFAVQRGFSGTIASGQRGVPGS